MKTNGRIITFDLLRGLAIIFMTIYHLSMVYGLQNTTYMHFVGALAAPLFIVISGFTLLLHNEKYNSPLKTIIRGFCLFSLAWSIDLVYHQSLNIDWDVIQLIAFCYLLSGICLAPKKYILRIIILSSTLVTIVIWNQPFTGVFSIWPFSLYFFAGYAWSCIIYNSKLKKNLLLLLTAVVISLPFFFLEKLPDPTSVVGFIFFCSAIISLVHLSKMGEHYGVITDHYFSFFIKFGKFPLTLYFFQQLITRISLKFGVLFDFYSNIYWNYAIFSCVVFSIMFLLTLVLTRFPNISVEGILIMVQSEIYRRTKHNG